jgi:Flp pilus assembly pilin Flp
MMTFIKNFRNDEDGAVTVDWVVLTAAIVGLGIAAITAVSQGVNSLGSDIATDLDTTNRIGLGVTDTTVGQ